MSNIDEAAAMSRSTGPSLDSPYPAGSRAPGAEQACEPPPQVRRARRGVDLGLPFRCAAA